MVIRDQGGLDGVPLAVCQLFLASCKMLWENGGFLLEQFDSIGRVPVWVAKCQIWKRCQAEASRNRAMRGCGQQLPGTHRVQGFLLTQGGTRVKVFVDGKIAKNVLTTLVIVYFPT